MDFCEAVRFIKAGCKLSRKGWSGKGQYIELASHISYKTPDGETVNPDHEAIGNAAIAFVGTSGIQVGWLATQSDMLANDWEIYYGQV